MSKKGQKVLASATILSLVMSTVAMAAPTAGTAVSGTSRVDTAIAIAKQSYSKWTDSKVAVIANGADAHLVDALTVAPLAYQKKAPVFLTLGTSTLEDSVISALKAQGVTTVYVVGGTVTTAVDAQLKAAGVATVTHLAGSTRFETAKAINKELEAVAAPTAYAVVNGYGLADALSIAAEAAKQNIEIVLASDPNTADVPAGAKTVYAVGGSGVLSDALVSKLNAKRFGGNSRFQTNAAVLNGLDASLDYTTTYVADGTDAHLVDSLPGSVLAAQTGSPIVLVSDTVDSSIVDIAKAKNGKITTVTPLGGAVNTNAVAIVVDPSKAPTPTTPTGVLAVSEVKATAANTIAVKFNQAPADTSKVVFTVSRSGSPMTVTTTWSDDKTTAKLTSSSNYPEATYDVSVKNDTADLGKGSVTYTVERVDKIVLASNVLAVTTGAATGYVGYNVYDQYGADITSNYIASDAYIKWTCGIGNITTDNKGLLTIAAYNNTVLTQYQTAVINAVTNNQSVPASTSATLTVSTTQGTVSDITLNKITSANNSTPTVGDTQKYYIDFTAKDMAGNITNNYKLIKAGLIMQGTDHDQLISSNSDLVTTKLVQSPSDDTKAALEVTIGSPNYDLVNDMPVTVTVTTYSGKSSSLNFTVNRKAKVESISLAAPTENIASGETKTVPFVAYDQAGKQVTKYSDIVGNKRVTISPESNAGHTSTGLFWDQDSDGNAVLKYHYAEAVQTGQTAQATITATVALTGKTSSITLNIGAPKVVNDFKVDDSVVLTNMEKNAVQKLDFGWNDGGFKVLDQYNREIDFTSDNSITDGSGNKTYYYIQATVPTPSNVAVTSDKAYNGYEIKLSGATVGTTSVKFELMKATGYNPATQAFSGVTSSGLSKTVNFSVLDDKDISSYTIDTISGPIYANYTTGTDQERDWNADPEVFGLTSNGAKVKLDKAKINGYYDDSSDFIATNDDENIKVFATTLAATKTGSSGNISVNVYNDNTARFQSATAAVKSTTDAPVAKSMSYSAQKIDRYDANSTTGITTDGNTITVSVAGTQKYYDSTKNLDSNGVATTGITYTTAQTTQLNLNQGDILNAIAGRSLTRFQSTNGTSKNRSYIYLFAKDQYGSKAMNLANVAIAETTVTSDGTTAGTKYVTISNDGNYTLNFDSHITNKSQLVGKYIVLTGFTANGQQQTIKIVFAN